MQDGRVDPGVVVDHEDPVDVEGQVQGLHAAQLPVLRVLPRTLAFQRGQRCGEDAIVDVGECPDVFGVAKECAPLAQV